MLITDNATATTESISIHVQQRKLYVPVDFLGMRQSKAICNNGDPVDYGIAHILKEIRMTRSFTHRQSKISKSFSELKQWYHHQIAIPYCLRRLHKWYFTIPQFLFLILKVLMYRRISSVLLYNINILLLPLHSMYQQIYFIQVLICKSLIMTNYIISFFCPEHYIPIKINPSSMGSLFSSTLHSKFHY